MKDSVPLTIRLQEVERVLRDNPKGLGRAEIAVLLGVHRSTISRAISRLAQFLPIRDIENVISLDLSRYEIAVRFTKDELQVLHEHAALASTRAGSNHADLKKAVEKLAHALGQERRKEPKSY